MKLNPFKKKKEEARPAPEDDEINESSQKKAEENGQGSLTFSNASGKRTHEVLEGFYVSEKSSLGNPSGQYSFRVKKNANKSEIKKEVSNLFNVKIKSIKILNTHEKRRDFGKHPGSKSGFKKAIVILKEGFTIGQAKP